MQNAGISHSFYFDNQLKIKEFIFLESMARTLHLCR